MSRHHEEEYSQPESHGNNNNFNFGGNFDSEIGEDDEYQSFKIFKESSMTFAKRY